MINTSINCAHCGLRPRRGDSIFCSDTCKQLFIEGGPAETIECFLCDAQADGIADAQNDGWTDVELFVEGYSCNYLGLCPDCKTEEDT